MDDAEDDLTDDERTAQFIALKVRERLLIKSMTPLQRAVYSMGGCPAGGWVLPDGPLDMLSEVVRDE